MIYSPWGRLHDSPLVVGQPQLLPVELVKQRVDLNTLKLDDLRPPLVEMLK